MELSIFLARVIGLYAIITTLAFLARRGEMMNIARDIIKNRGLIYTIAAIELILALLILVSHWVWSGWPVIITLVGVLMLLDALTYLFLPRETTERLLETYLRPELMWPFIVFFLILGVYLLTVGF